MLRKNSYYFPRADTAKCELLFSSCIANNGRILFPPRIKIPEKETQLDASHSPPPDNGGGRVLGYSQASIIMAKYFSDVLVSKILHRSEIHPSKILHKSEKCARAGGGGSKNKPNANLNIPSNWAVFSIRFVIFF